MTLGETRIEQKKETTANGKMGGRGVSLGLGVRGISEDLGVGIKLSNGRGFSF